MSKKTAAAAPVTATNDVAEVKKTPAKKTAPKTVKKTVAKVEETPVTETPKPPKKAAPKKAAKVAPVKSPADMTDDELMAEMQRRSAAKSAATPAVVEAPAKVEEEIDMDMLSAESAKVEPELTVTDTSTKRKSKLAPTDKAAIVKLWSLIDPKLGYGLSKSFDDGRMLVRLDSRGVIVMFSPVTSDTQELLHFKFTEDGKALFVEFDKSPQLLGEPLPEKIPTRASLNRAATKGMTTKKAAKELDAKVGEALVETKDAPVEDFEPWKANTLPALLARLADRHVMTVRGVISFGDVLTRHEIDPKALTEEVLTAAESIDRKWRQSLKELQTKFNGGVDIESLTSVAPKSSAPVKSKTERQAEREARREAVAKEKTDKADAPKKVGKYPVNLGGDDHSCTSVIRWLGGHGYGVEEAKATLDALGIEGLSDATIKTQIYRGAKGDDMPEADLNDDEVEVLEATLAEAMAAKKKPAKKSKK